MPNQEIFKKGITQITPDKNPNTSGGSTQSSGQSVSDKDDQRQADDRSNEKN